MTRNLKRNLGKGDVQNKINELLNLTSIPKSQLRAERIRPSWDIIFLRNAVLWASRSHDAQTQCGCILVKNNTILSSGYNGYIRGIDDTILPNLRPHKYKFMIHAEHNAIFNCVRNGVSTDGATAYITAAPCNDCLQYMWQAGISHIVYSNFSNPEMLNNSKFIDHQKGLLLLINSGEDNLLTMNFINKNDVLPKFKNETNTS